MSKTKIYNSIGFFSVMFTLSIFLWWWPRYQHTTTITFLNVGEGDAILIAQGSNQMLIDSGRTGKELLARLGRHIPFWDRTIEVVLATHPDADHIGGFRAVVSAYDVEMFLSSGAESDTETFVLLVNALAIRQREMTTIFRGSTVQFPYGGVLTIEYPLAPIPKEMKDANTGSIVGRFVFGDTEVLLTGDLPEEEKVLVNTQPADILKVAHHGSKYSTSADFLGMVQPKEAVISVGKNSYGHPSEDVLKRLQEQRVLVRRTDTDGDIQYRCTEKSARCIFVY